MAFVNIFDLLHAQRAWKPSCRRPTKSRPRLITRLPRPASTARLPPASNSSKASVMRGWASPIPPSPSTTTPIHITSITSDCRPHNHADFGPFDTIRLQRTAFQLWKKDGPAGIKAGTAGAGQRFRHCQGGELLPKAATTPSPPPAGAPAGGRRYRSAAGLQYGFAAELVGHGAGSGVNAVKAAGFGWVKQQVRWDGLQPAAGGAIGWGTLDNAVSAAQGAGFKVMFSVVAAPAGRRTPAANSPRTHPTRRRSSPDGHPLQGQGPGQRSGMRRTSPRKSAPGDDQRRQLRRGAQGRLPGHKAADPRRSWFGRAHANGVNDPNIAFRDFTYLQQMYATRVAR